jgi:hypothetical protein
MIDVREHGGSFGGGMRLNGTEETYKIRAGDTINIGDFVDYINGEIGTHDAWSDGWNPEGVLVITAGKVGYMSATQLDSTRALIVYEDRNNSLYATARVATINGNQITLGTPLVFFNGQPSYVKVIKVDTDKALAVWNSTSGKAVVLSISGTTVTAGTVIDYQSTYYGNFPQLCLLDVNKVILMNGSASDLMGIVITISGTTITAGPRSNIIPGTTTSYFRITKMTINHFLVVYANGSGYCYVSLFTTSGTTISFLSSVMISSVYSPYLVIENIDMTHALIVWSDSTLNRIFTNVITWNTGNNTISASGSILIEAVYGTYTELIKIGTNKFLVSYSSNQRRTKVISVAVDYTISFYNAVLFPTNKGSYSSNLVFMSTGLILDMYNSDETTQQTCCEVLKPINNQKFGVAKQAGTGGNSIKIVR